MKMIPKQKRNKISLMQILLLSVGVIASTTKFNPEPTQPQIWPTHASESLEVTKVETVKSIQHPTSPTAEVIPLITYHWQRDAQGEQLRRSHLSMGGFDSPLHQALSAKVSPRDFSAAQYNFHQIILLLHNLSSRIALPRAAIDDDTVARDEPYDISPLDLALIPEEYREISETMVQINEENLVIICTSQPQEGVAEWKFLKVCPQQKQTLLGFLKDVRNQGGKLAVLKERLKRARAVDLEALEDGLYICAPKEGTTCASAPTGTGTEKWQDFLSSVYRQKPSASVNLMSISSDSETRTSATVSQHTEMAVSSVPPMASEITSNEAPATQTSATNFTTKLPAWKHSKPKKPLKPSKTWNRRPPLLPPR